MNDPLAESIPANALPVKIGGVLAGIIAEEQNQAAARKNQKSVIQAQLEHIDFIMLEKLRIKYPSIDRLIVERDELASFKESLENDTKPKSAARRN